MIWRKGASREGRHCGGTVTHSRCTQSTRPWRRYSQSSPGRTEVYSLCLVPISAGAASHLLALSISRGCLRCVDSLMTKAGKHRELVAAEIMKAVQRTLKPSPTHLPSLTRTVSTISHLVLLFLQRSKLMFLELTQLERKPRRLSSVIASRIGRPKNLL